MSVGIKRRVVNDVVYSNAPFRVTHQSTFCKHSDGKPVALDLLFEGYVDVDSQEARSVFISTHTGLPINDPKETTGNTNRDRKAIELYFNSPIVSYAQIAGDNGNFRLVMIGAKNRIHYVFMRGNISFTFYIGANAHTPQEAVIALLTNNLAKCPRVYRRTSGTIKDFFERVLFSVTTEPLEFECVVADKNGKHVPATVYFDPATPKGSKIRIKDTLFDYVLAQFPKTQVANAI